MIIIKEKSVKEAYFQHDTVKTLQISGTKARIAIEIDIAKTVKALVYDSNRYSIPRDQLDPGYLAEVIAHQLDWQAYVLSANDDHELARVLAELNDN
jgi:hypothetical protein